MKLDRKHLCWIVLVVAAILIFFRTIDYVVCTSARLAHAQRRYRHLHRRRRLTAVCHKRRRGQWTAFALTPIRCLIEPGSRGSPAAPFHAAQLFRILLASLVFLPALVLFLLELFMRAS